MTDDCGVWRLYDEFARAFDRDRSRGLIELAWLSAVRSGLGPGGHVLDLGCGTGEPIGRWFLEAGFKLTGVDAAPAMVAICRERFFQANWIVADMRVLDLGSRYDAIIAWDSLFHLPCADQRAMFAVFARHIAPGGALLFTTGPRAGTAISDFHGRPLFHASLDPRDYRRLLDEAGFTVVDNAIEDESCGRHTVWLARATTPGR